MSERLLAAADLVKRFETVTALDRVSLSLDAGEVRGLLGPNGAGKTTLLRILFGLVRADAGTVSLLGARLAFGAGLPAVAGFVEQPAFYPYLSGRANLALLAELDADADLERVEEALSRVSLERRADDRVAGYSTGMRQRLGIAAALLRSPRVLMLDEPTAGLDPDGVRDVLALVRELAATGVAVLLSSHQIDEVESICDTFTLLSGGRTVWEGDASALRSQAGPSAWALSSADDARALALAAHAPELSVEAAGDRDEGLVLRGPLDAVDGYVIALGRAGVAIRRLERRESPLAARFFALTADPETARDAGAAR
jgi:ABC-2 type transport system ATP-binding protein